MSPGSPVEVHGTVASGLEPVLHAFASNFAERGELGASFAVVQDGAALVDIWGGLADRKRQRPWDHSTLSVLFSGSKGLVGCCLLLLIDRDQLDLDTPVAAYWPEFAAGGKGAVRVLEAITHRAGVPGLSPRITVPEATDARRMAELVAAEAKIDEPGFIYHALTFGWICGELVRRIDGRSIGQFFAEEIAQPLGLDVWIGLPEQHEPRVATAELGSSWESPGSGDPAEVDFDDPLMERIYANPPRFMEGFLPANTRSWHAAEIPSTSGIGDARSLARLYACLANGGRIDADRQLVSPETANLARQCLIRARDPYMPHEFALSVGFWLPSQGKTLGPPSDAFGAFGAGGSCQGAWPEHRLGFGYLHNRLDGDSGHEDPRADALLASLYEAIS